MNKEELVNFLCDWIDGNIGRYIGWNEWGSQRVVDPDRLKEELNKILKDYVL